jgi:hypothetical protein
VGREQQEGGERAGILRQAQNERNVGLRFFDKLRMSVMKGSE